MPLAACMVSLQFLLQLVRLSRPFGLSLQRLFESFDMFVQDSIFSFSLMSLSICLHVHFFVVCLFCILYFICILCSYCCLLGILTWITVWWLSWDQQPPSRATSSVADTICPHPLQLVTYRYYPDSVCAAYHIIIVSLIVHHWLHFLLLSITSDTITKLKYIILIILEITLTI